eukprot:TRINITY_DN7028_c0_g1_i1.p1 TRINITY_DN7028_c0_g1~~TRINITY_DN7028_c0_g1_i1.p1  ORF type:complete len:1107 (+),score=237.67 TRINITY_DN7028_c0_g1_i1:37-3357(+)
MSRRRDWGAGEFGTSSTVAGATRESEGEISGWHVCENGVPMGSDNHVNEALFALSNGYIGIRGTFEEGYDGPKDAKGNVPSEQGIFINGFYEGHVIKYPEVGYGQAETDSVMLNVINSKIITMTVDGEPFSMWGKGSLTDYHRELNLQEGTLTRSLTWSSPAGKKVRLETTRVVPLKETRKHIFFQEYNVTPLSDDIKEITISSDMDGQVTNKPQSKDPRVGAGFSGQVLKMVERKCEDGDFSYIKSQTSFSELDMICAMSNKCNVDGVPTTPECKLVDAQKISHKFTIVNPSKDKPIKLTKIVSYATTQGLNGSGHSVDDLIPVAKTHLDAAIKSGVAHLKTEQIEFLADFYDSGDIVIEGDDLLQQGMRFNIFHLVQAVGRDGMTNIGAKGITGEGYCGHYFWDTEIYILPFFLYTKPEIARKLVSFRVSTLDKARERAKQLGGINKGALYPWRTIHGEECSSYFPAGTAQLHINADIAWAFKHYFEATNDTELLINGGAEMLFEMARFWLEYGSWSPGGHFQLHCVTGPDEYTALVNNNYYTNVMVQDALNYAVNTAELLKHEHAEEYKLLCEKIGLTNDELTAMQEAADKMFLPYDKFIGVHPQDDSFLQKKEWDFENTPHDKYPLLLHFHYLIIYKYKVIKQADLVLALLLQGQQFTDKEKKLNFDYYEPLTTHDSSLSTAVYSVMAAEIGYYQKAYNYFKCTARMDLDNIHHNSQNGIHTACMAGTWMCVVRGFAGYRIYKGVMHLNPYLPQEWNGYKFCLSYHGAVLEVRVNKRSVVYTCKKGARVNFVHANTQKVYLKEGKSKELYLKDKFEDLTSLNFDSVVIDIDAAIPKIQRAHYESWHEVLLGLNLGTEFTVCDYKKFLMNQIGTHRYAGLELYLNEQGVTIPFGKSHDAPGTQSLWALGNKKTEVMKRMMDEDPPSASSTMVKFVKDLKNEGIKVGLVSYSKSGEKMITHSGLKRYVDAYITGKDMGVLGLRGKPHMDMYHRVVEQLFTDPKRCVVIIDDPIGFDPEQIARFKYSISYPVTSFELQTVCDLDELEHEHLHMGISRVIKDPSAPLNSEIIDDWVLGSEPYDMRIARIKNECLRRTSSKIMQLRQ